MLSVLRRLFNPSDSLFLIFRELLWRCLLGATIIYLLLDPDPSRNIRLNGAAYIGFVIWCYYDGLFARRNWPRALGEAAIWYLIAIQIAKLLIANFGLPSASG